MAKIGVKHPVFVPLAESGGTTTYDDGVVLGKAIKIDVKINTSNEKLYGDDDVAEEEKEFQDGTISLNPDHLEQEHRALMLGHKFVPTVISGNTVNMLVSNADDKAPYGGFGYYGKEVKNGVKKWHAYFHPKTRFSEPDDSLETRGEKTSFQTPTIEGEIYRDLNGDWKKDVVVDTEAKAIEWLEALANIGESATLTALNAAITAATALDAEDYTSASWVAVSNSLTTANAIKVQSGVGQNAVDLATTTLNNAVTALVARV